MPDFERITSFQNSKIKLARKLQDKRQRDRENLFVIDDTRDLQRALVCQYEVDFVFYCPDLADEQDTQLAQSLEGPVYAITPDLMQKASYRQNPGGLVTVLKQKPEQTIHDAASIEPHHILGLAELSKPGNIGALLRTADAAGFEHIFLIDTRLDIYNPNIIRSSTGTCFLNNLYSVSSQEALQFFRDRACQIVAAHPTGKQNLYSFNFQQRTAVILGAEATGLTPLWLANCDHLVQIPMSGTLADSLNVSVSGAIIMYEAFRQRTQP